MKTKIIVFTSLVLFTLLVSSAGVVAQDPDHEGGQESGQENAPGAARISLMRGEVSTQRGDSGDWVAATLNAPVMTGDRVATAAGSRAELQLDYADVLRLDQSGEVRLAEVANNRIQLEVGSGLVDYVSMKGAQARAEIDTPNVAVQPSGEGVYRIEVKANGQTLVIIRRGEAQVSTPQGSATAHAGEMVTVQGSSNDAQYRVDPAPPQDEWDAFNDQRERAVAKAQSYRYTNRYYTGAADLDSSGHWDYVPGYDWCWTPYVNTGWVPYTDGRWVWEPYYGWTWVSSEPWGWAPYHYGRWFLRGSAWSWWPGPVWGAGIGYRPIWAPAYVSFLGFGFGGRHFSFGFGFGFGSIGWLPIGPRDCYVPWYGRGGYYNHYNSVNVRNFTNVTNITNIRNITNVNNAMGPLYRGRNGISNLEALQRGNARVQQAFSVVPSDRFGQGNPTGVIQHPSLSSLGEGRLVAGGLPVVPTKASLAASNRVVNSAALPRTPGQQRFFTRQRPTAVSQSSFGQRQSQLRQMVQQQHTATTMNPTASNAGSNRGVNPALPGPNGNSRIMGGPGNTPGAATNGRQFGNAPQAGNGIAQQRPAGGWQRFGTPSGQPQMNRNLSQAPNPGGTPQSSQARAPQGLAGSSTPTPGSNWQRFGPRPGPAGSQPAVRQQNVPAQGGRFSGAAPGLTAGPQGGTLPGGNGGYGGPGSLRQPVPAPARPQPQSNWPPPNRPQTDRPRYQSQPAPQPRAGGYFSQPGRPGWGGFSPEASQRPALQLNKPIVTQRNPSHGGDGYTAPRAYGYGGGSGGARENSGGGGSYNRGGGNGGGRASGGESRQGGSGGHSGGSHSRR